MTPEQTEIPGMPSLPAATTPVAAGSGRHAQALEIALTERPIPRRWAMAVSLARAAVHALDLAEAKRDLPAITAALRTARQALLDLQLIPDPDSPILPGDEGGADILDDVADPTLAPPA